MLNLKKFEKAALLDCISSKIKGGTYTYDNPIVIDHGTIFIGNAYRTYEDRRTDSGLQGEHDICGIITDDGEAPSGNP